MTEISDSDMQKLYENFETTRLLSAVDQIDELRGYLSDQENCAPPEIRDDMLKLHQLAMDVVNNGDKGKVLEMFELADDLQSQVSDMDEALSKIKKTLTALTSNCPDNLYD